MILLLAFAVPVVVGGIAFMLGGKRITPMELAAQLAAMLLVLGVTYACMLSGSTSDTELWNGSIANKTKEWGGCCHSYPCNCHEVCSGGKDNTCSEVCDTCSARAASV